MYQTKVGKVYHFLVYNDIHNFGAHSMNIQPFSVPTIRREVYLGDNYDLSGCKKKEIEKCKKAIDKCHAYFKSREGIFVTGNHELNYPDETISDNVQVGDILFTHGDLGVLWPLAKGRKYRAKKPGASMFKRMFFVPMLDLYRKVFKRYNISADAMARAVIMARKYNCRYIVCGHGHPHLETRRTYKGVTLIVLPRGVNELSIVV